MRLGSLALWVMISVALVIVGEAEPLGGLEEDEDEADNDEEENGENDPHDHSYCLTSQCVPEGKEKSQFALSWMHCHLHLPAKHYLVWPQITCFNSDWK